MDWNPIGHFGVGLILVIATLAVLLVLLWIILPFAVFAMNSKLGELLREMRATNACLHEIRNALDTSGAPRIRAER